MSLSIYLIEFNTIVLAECCLWEKYAAFDVCLLLLFSEVFSRKSRRDINCPKKFMSKDLTDIWKEHKKIIFSTSVHFTLTSTAENLMLSVRSKLLLDKHLVSAVGSLESLGKSVEQQTYRASIHYLSVIYSLSNPFRQT